MEITEDPSAPSHPWNGYACDVGRTSDIIFTEIGNWTKLLITKASAGCSLSEATSPFPTTWKLLSGGYFHGITSRGDGITTTTSAIITILSALPRDTAPD